MNAIDRYACTGCREMGLTTTTYKVHNARATASDNTAQDDDDDENNSEYDDGADDASDSGDSADSDDEPVVSSVGTRERPAASKVYNSPASTLLRMHTGAILFSSRPNT
jgi:hypothetical protein